MFVEHSKYQLSQSTEFRRKNKIVLGHQNRRIKQRVLLDFSDSLEEIEWDEKEKEEKKNVKGSSENGYAITLKRQIYPQKKWF